MGRRRPDLGEGGSENMWITRQRWENLYFVHFRGPASPVANALPKQLQLDSWQGDAILSVVPFRMTRVRFPFLPPLPLVSELWELNLRTYVRCGSQRGIYFFTLESDNPVATWVARNFFGLPYRNAHLTAHISDQTLRVDLNRADFVCSLNMEYDDRAPENLEFEKWATDRFCLFNVWRGVTKRGDVLHAPWLLRSARVNRWQGNFLNLVPGALDFKFFNASYSSCMDVSFKPFSSQQV